MKRVALLGPYAHKPRIQAFEVSCEDAGFEVHHLIDSRKIDPQDFEFAFTCGTHAGEKAAMWKFKQAGRRVVVLDLGYINRASFDDQSGYHQVGLDRIGWLPADSQAGDRFESLGIDLLDNSTTESGTILVLGQVEGDSQHPFLRTRPMHLWLARRVELWEIGNGHDHQLRTKIYRPHPLSGDPGISGWKFQTPNEIPLEEAVAAASMVITYNSTAGVEAIRQGKDVICHESAHYAEVAYASKFKDRVDYFHRLAYAQWTLQEIRNGLALNFLLPDLLKHQRKETIS